MQRLKSQKLKSYDNCFNGLVTEYELLEGDRTHEDILDLFLSGESNSQDDVLKETTEFGTPIDDAMSCFLKLADKTKFLKRIFVNTRHLL